ncbi:MAG: hypothetical protein KC800_18615 [Candidatus Eremiobacteraeota bacterium]|nr:hypothetical protein [Candidatus Eremiobacteraeota bacterium]
MQIQSVRMARPPVREAALEFSREDGSYRLNRHDFEDSFVARVEDHLTELAGEKIDLPDFGEQNLQAAFKVAAQVIGVGPALALAGDAMASLVSDKDRDDFNVGTLHRMSAQPFDRVQSSETLIYAGPQDKVGYGASTVNGVILPNGFEPLVPHPVGAFIVGHELGHVEGNHVVKGFGRDYMARELSGTEYGETAAEHAKLLQWESEYEADRRGVSYALEQGHSAELVRAGVQKSFGITGADSSDTHPADDSRLQRIDEALEALSH